MPFFPKVFHSGQKESNNRSRSKSELAQPCLKVQSQEAESALSNAWFRTTVAAEEVQELLHICTQEIKSRGLETPFVLLPFRPDSNLHLAQSFIRDFFNRSYGAHEIQRLQQLYSGLRLVEPLVLCSIVKWCWSRLAGGVVTWKTYELFRSGEHESHMIRNSFDTFIPLSVESEARQILVFDFFDLLSSIAAHGKTNGLGGRKLSRLAGWWAFDHLDESKGFDGGYRSWASAANATSHLFFAYLRSRSPDPEIDKSGISHIPRSLEALVAQTNYPPKTPASFQAWTTRIVVNVDSVSSTPHALLRRANQFDYRNEDNNLQQFGRQDDPVDILTPECQRVLECISSADITSGTASPKQSSWSRFEDTGFSQIPNSNDRMATGENTISSRTVSDSSLLHSKTARFPNVRPKTPNWADFESSGFSTNPLDNSLASLLISPSVMLPPLSVPTHPKSPPHSYPGSPLDDGRYDELSAISHLHLDDTFWWVWISSLAGEETPARKAIFRRCAFVEMQTTEGCWLILEEHVRRLAEKKEEPEIILVKKRNRLGFSNIGRTRRKSSAKYHAHLVDHSNSSKLTVNTNDSTEEQARVHAVAAAIVQKQQEENELKAVTRRGRMDEDARAKTTSVLTMQPTKYADVIPALQWAKNFDKKEKQAKYLGDLTNMRGLGSPNSLDKALPMSPQYRVKREERVLPTPPPITKMIFGLAEAQPEQLMIPPSSPRVMSPSPLDAVPVTIASPISPVSREPGPRDSRGNTSFPETPTRVTRRPVDTRHEQLIRKLGIPSPLGSNPSPHVVSQEESIEQAPKAANSPSHLGKFPAAKARPKMFQKSSTGSVRGLVNIFNKRRTDLTQLLVNQAIASPSERSDQVFAPVIEKRISEHTPPTPPEGNSRPASPVAERLPRLPAHNEEVEPTALEPNHFYQSPPQSPTSFNSHNANQHFSTFSSAEATNSEPPHSTQTSVPTFTTRAAALLAPISLSDLDPAQAAFAHVSAYITPSVSPEPQMTSDCGSQGEFDYTSDNISIRSVRLAPQPVLPAIVHKPSFSHDRWAQIRKHAAERRASEDQQNQHGMSVAGFTERTDDTDASGFDEPIEARVARIKARVAALTNINNNTSLSHNIYQPAPGATSNRWADLD